MGTKRLVVIGASAGGIEALRELVALLPTDFAAPICIVVHTSPQSPGVLDAILSRAGTVPAHNARDRERLKGGRIYVAPPDYHLLVEPGVIRVTKGPKENRFRPAIDPLFRSAAQVYGPSAIGIILTGNLDDGTAGLWAIKQLGGTAVVQHPEDALFPSMPLSALNHVRVDYSIPIPEMVPLLVRLTAEPVEEATPAAELKSLEVEVDIAKETRPLAAGIRDIAEPSIFACPECHGVLLQLKEGGRVRFRCHTGHAYSREALLAAVAEGTEEALWNAVRALEEGEMLLSALGEHAKDHHADDATALLARAEEARRKSEAVRGLLTEPNALTVEP